MEILIVTSLMIVSIASWLIVGSIMINHGKVQEPKRQFIDRIMYFIFVLIMTVSFIVLTAYIQLYMFGFVILISMIFCIGLSDVRFNNQMDKIYFYYDKVLNKFIGK